MKTRRRSSERATNIREDGIQLSGRDPLRYAPLREPYAARSGARPAESGTAETVTRLHPRSRQRGLQWRP